MRSFYDLYAIPNFSVAARSLHDHKPTVTRALDVLNMTIDLQVTARSVVMQKKKNQKCIYSILTKMYLFDPYKSVWKKKLYLSMAYTNIT